MDLAPATVGDTLNVAQVVPCTEAEGPGRRFALWLQGCPLRCPGCCNPAMLPFAGGEAMRVERLAEAVRAAGGPGGIEGITLLGGEPTAQAGGAAELARRARELGLSVMVFSGFTLEELRARPEPAVADLLDRTDLLVDGPYLRDQPEPHRRWIGSANQRVHFLTGRYRADDPRWRRRNTLEVRLEGSVVSVNGFPAPSAVGLWRRPGGDKGARP